MTAESFVDDLISLGVPAARVIKPHEVPELAMNRARRFYDTIDHPSVGRYRLAGIPILFEHGPERTVRRPTAAFGADTADVLREVLALDDAEIELLLSDGIAGGLPITPKGFG